jgi:hypothetical protein
VCDQHGGFWRDGWCPTCESESDRASA